LKEVVVFACLEDRLAARANELVHNWHCAAARASVWDESGEEFEFHRREADKTFKTIGKLLLPWYKIWTETEGKTLAQLWKEFKEEEKDPEFQKWRAQVKRDLAAITARKKEIAEALKNVAVARSTRDEERRTRERTRRATKDRHYRR